MQRTDKKKEEIMGMVFRILCVLFVFVLSGAACATAPQTKVPAPTAKQMVVITIDPETGSVVTAQDNFGKTLNSPVQGQTQVGTLTTSMTPVTITVGLSPTSQPVVQPTSASGGTLSVTTSSALTSASCRLIYINGSYRCLP